MEILSRTQKEIPREFVISALNATNYDVVAGFDLLELLFGDINGDGFLCSVVKRSNIVDAAEDQSNAKNSIETDEVFAWK